MRSKMIIFICFLRVKIFIICLVTILNSIFLLSARNPFQFKDSEIVILGKGILQKNKKCVVYKKDNKLFIKWLGKEKSGSKNEFNTK